MKQILFWHVVSPMISRSQRHFCQLTRYKVPWPHFLTAPSALLYKKKHYRLKKKLNNRAPFNWETERIGTENVVASMIKRLQYADQTPPSCHTAGTQATVWTEELWDRNMIRKINSKIRAAVNGKWLTGKHSDMLIVLLLEHSKQGFVSSGLGWCPAKTESTAFIQKPRFQCLG